MKVEDGDGDLIILSKYIIRELTIKNERIC